MKSVAFGFILTGLLSYSVFAQAQVPNDPEALTQYSLYYEYYKNKDYASALPYIRWMLQNRPVFRISPSTPADRNWERAVEIYEGVAALQQDGAKKKAYLDSALALHDRVIEVMKQHQVADFDEARWYLMKGAFLQRHAEQYPDRQGEVLELYLKGFRMAPDRTPPYYPTYIAAELVRQGRMEEALAFMDEAEPYYKDNAEVKNYFDQLRDQLLRRPEDRVAFVERKFSENPQNVDLAKELFELYRLRPSSTSCSDNWSWKTATTPRPCSITKRRSPSIPIRRRARSSTTTWRWLIRIWADSPWRAPMPEGPSRRIPIGENPIC
jgi:tetratricopeptide (TPR) repeat protein